MGIWIRTQDSVNLLMCTNLVIKTRTIQKEEQVALFSQEVLLGEYEDIEEALEVLNLIQEHIDKNGKTFDMPKFGFMS